MGGLYIYIIYMRSPHVPHVSVNLLVSFIYLNIRQQYWGSRYSIIVKRVEFSVEQEKKKRVSFIFRPPPTKLFIYSTAAENRETSYKYLQQHFSKGYPDESYNIPAVSYLRVQWS